MLLFFLFTAVLLAPPVVITGLWVAARRYHAHHPAAMPDSEVLVLARVAAAACSLLPVLQMVAGILRWRTGEAGLYLWYAVPAVGLLLAVFAVAAFLAQARGRERGVASATVLVSFALLVLITLLTGAEGV